MGRPRKSLQKKPDLESGSRSARRTLEIFELLLKRGEPQTVAKIIATLKIPKSTTYELVKTLTDAGYISANSRGGGLFLGPKLYELGMAYGNNVDLLRDGNAIVEELRDETGETVQLSVLDKNQMMVVLKAEGIRHLRIISNVGSRVPVNWAAAGRLLVSDMDDRTLTALLKETTCQSPTGKAFTDVQKLITQVRSFRRQGFATELNEANEHAGCIAAPVINTAGRCIAALSVVVPEQRMVKPNREELIASVTRAAARLSRFVG